MLGEMEGPVEDSFRLLRICLLRPPPAWIELPSRSRSSVEVELAVGVTDDYGVHFDAFETLNLSITLVDASTGLPTPSARLELKPHDPSTGFTISSSRGQFHSLKPTLVFDRTLAALPSAIRFVVSISTDKMEPVLLLSKASTRMLELVGESTQVPFESWDENRYVSMRVSSGDVELKISKSMSKGKGKAEEPRLSSTKAQTALRQLHLPATASSMPLPTPISIIERPGLNNSTGQRLWDCSIGLSCYLSLHPSALHSSTPPYSKPRVSEDGRPSKRARLDAGPSSTESSPPNLRVLELGAGCALVGIVVGRLLANAVRVEIVVSDVQVTVDTTLANNLANNLPAPPPPDSPSPLPHSLPIHAKILDWGILNDEQKDQLWTSQDAPHHITLLGSDILYNPSSHAVLLQTLLSFLQHSPSTSAHALIAYKARTEGDDGIFLQAREAGLEVGKVWEWGSIAVYEFGAGNVGGAAQIEE